MLPNFASLEIPRDCALLFNLTKIVRSKSQIIFERDNSPSTTTITMRCLRRSIPLPPTHSPKLTRIIHTTRPLLADENFTSDEYDQNEANQVADHSFRLPSRADSVAYARTNSERALRRWQESQDPQKRLKFMTMGREFAIPYNLTQHSYMNVNHLRELRTYYRKIMYEMPQFGRTDPFILLVMGGGG